MQRVQFLLIGGWVLGLLASAAGSAQAQVYYVPSSSIQTVPVTQSVVTRTYVSSRSDGGFGGGSSSFHAGNNRRSAPPVYVENHYLPESSFDSAVISSEPVVVSSPVVSSRVISSRPLTVSRSRVFSEPVVSSRAVIVSGPVIYSEPVVVSQPIRVQRSMIVSSPRVTREKVESRPNHYEYEQKGKFEAFDGRRVKTYRYEYELDHRPGRVKIEFDIDD